MAYSKSAARPEATIPPYFLGFNRAQLWRILRLTWSEIRSDDVFGRAAQLAYYFFLALFPFLICVVACLSIFGTADRGKALLFELVTRFVPPPASQLISDTFNEILQSTGPLKMSIGIIASLWAASMGMTAVMDTLNAAYRVEESRSLIKQYAVATGLTICIALLSVAAVLIVVFGDKVTGALHHRHYLGTAWTIAQWPLGIVVLLYVFAITYYFAPNLRTRQWHWISPGGITGIFLLLVTSYGLRAYLHYFRNYSAAYGSFGAVIVLLIYFYLSGMAVLAGGVLNGVLERLAIDRVTKKTR